jgi:hypothetical protein
MMTLLELGDLILLVASVVGIVFAVSYGLFFKWWKTAAGRAVFAFVVSLDLTFLLNMSGRWLGVDYPGRDIVRIAVYTFVLGSVSYLLYVLWRSWFRGRAVLDLETRERKTGVIDVVE